MQSKTRENWHKPGVLTPQTLTAGSHGDVLEKEDARYQEDGQGRPREHCAERQARCGQDADLHPRVAPGGGEN